MRTTLVVAITLWVLTSLGARAETVTPDQIVALSKAGVSEAVILALIDRDQSSFSIEPDQVIALKTQGLSDAIIVAMLRSGRAARDQAAAADAARAAAILAPPLAPEVTIVGHGPDTPNITHDGYSFVPGYDYPAPVPTIAPAIIPIPFPVPTIGRSRQAAPHRDRMMCLAQTTGRGGPGGPTLSWVTECPPVMQRSLRRSIQ